MSEWRKVEWKDLGRIEEDRVEKDYPDDEKRRKEEEESKEPLGRVRRANWRKMKVRRRELG